MIRRALSHLGIALLGGTTLCACLARAVVDVQPAPVEQHCEEVTRRCEELDLSLQLHPVAETDFDSEERMCAGVDTVSIEMVDGLAVANYACADIVLLLPAYADFELDGNEFEDTHLTVTSDQPASLHFSNASIRRSRVRIEGSAVVYIESGSYVADSTIVASPTSTGRILTVANSTLDSVAIHTNAYSEIRASGITALNGIVDVGQLVSDESVWDGTRMRMLDAVIAGGSFESTQIDVGLASWVSVRLQATTIHRCDEMHFFDSQLINTDTVACTWPVDMQDGGVSGSRLRGALSAQRTNFSDTAFGPENEQELRFTKATITSSAFCSVHELRASDSQFECVSCNPEISSAHLTHSSVRAPQCESLENASLTPELN